MRVDIGLASAVKGREDEFPTLARALADTRPARATKIEWLVEQDGQREVWFNYTQIQREPYGDDRAGTLTQHLRMIEMGLVHGVRSFNLGGVGPYGTCGGYLELLGRELQDGDHLSLRVLRDLCHIEHEGMRPEFLTEYSLEVHPAALAAA